MSYRSIGSRYSPQSPSETQRESSSETMSPVYADRPIKPLPKRRLKDRLSLEAAETISYPPAPPTAASTFYSSSYELSAQQGHKALPNGSTNDVDRALINAQSSGFPTKDVPYEFHGTDPISDDEIAITVRQDGYRSHAIRAQSRSVASSADSADGYESFENTNNKKKRKIPTSAGSGALHPSLSNSLSADLASMGLSNSVDGSADTQDGGLAQYYGSGERVPGNAISGLGRGRYGRSGRRDTRNPLGASVNASNAWQTGARLPASHAVGKYISKDRAGDNGIISQAIAEAAASAASMDKGQENIGLMEQQQRSARRNTPAAQFTFNMDSEAAKGPSWPGDQYAPRPGHVAAQQQMPVRHGRGYSQGTQTSPTMGGLGQGAASSQQPAPPPKPRRPAHLRYLRAARDRKMNQEYENMRNPLRSEDIWICEFCEYEAIFGRPPEALIRQYEIKDAHERKRQAEKRRLLEKAKSKGRKARKGTKASKANAAAAVAANAQAGGASHANGHYYDQQAYEHDDQYDGDAGNDYYLGDVNGDVGYEDDPPISTPNTFLPPNAGSKIPAPTQHHGASPRPADRSSYGPGPGGGETHQRVTA